MGNEKKVEKIMNEWWDKEHSNDLRCSGDFSWDEIKEFGLFLLEKIRTMESEYEEKVVDLKLGNKEPIKERIKELEEIGLSNDASVIIALGERTSQFK